MIGLAEGLVNRINAVVAGVNAHAATGCALAVPQPSDEVVLEVLRSDDQSVWLPFMDEEYEGVASGEATFYADSAFPVLIGRGVLPAGERRRARRALPPGQGR